MDSGATKNRKKITMLDLLVSIQSEQPEIRSEKFLFSMALKLINSRAVLLSGSYADTKLPLK